MGEGRAKAPVPTHEPEPHREFKKLSSSFCSAGVSRWKFSVTSLASPLWRAIASSKRTESPSCIKRECVLSPQSQFFSLFVGQGRRNVAKNVLRSSDNELISPMRCCLNERSSSIKSAPLTVGLFGAVIESSHFPLSHRVEAKKPQSIR